MTPAFSYEMVAEAFMKWFETQNGERTSSEEARCRERIISQIKRFYPNEERLSQDAHQGTSNNPRFSVNPAAQ